MAIFLYKLILYRNKIFTVIIECCQRVMNFLERLLWEIKYFLNNANKPLIASVFAGGGVLLLSTILVLSLLEEQSPHKNKSLYANSNVNVMQSALSTSMEVSTDKLISQNDLSKSVTEEITTTRTNSLNEITEVITDTKVTEIKAEIKKEEERLAKIEEERKAKEEAEKKEKEKIRIAESKKRSQSNANYSVEQSGDIITINGKKYRIVATYRNAHATAYDNGLSSTGKQPGDAGYAKTASGATTHWGTMAVDRRYHNFGDMFYVVDNISALNKQPNGKIFIAEDTGSAIKGQNRFDLWFGNYSDAMQFGRRTLDTVYKIKPVN